MWDWLSKFWSDLTWQEISLGLACGVVSFVVGTLAVRFFLLKLPATYFQDDHPRAFAWEDRHPALRWTALIGKNLLGWLVIGIGIILALPGVPGPGFLTILIGVLLINFPGKRRLEKKLVGHPGVLSRINSFRARHGKLPLVVSPEPAKPASEIQVVNTETQQDGKPTGPVM